MSDFYYLYDNERIEMLDFVPESVTSILEIGCWTGKFAARLKQRNNWEVWDIEQDPIAAHDA